MRGIEIHDRVVGATGRNVLAELDQRVPRSFYWSLTLLATIGGFLFGYDTANIGSALPFVPYTLGSLATVASFAILPETKGRSVEEIAHVFDRQAAQNPGMPGPRGANAAEA